jgi:hypothetical protein
LFYDIIVVGGGVAGVAAAVQAGRAGLKVALIEKTALLGGLASSGLINVFLPICDGNGTQVSFGICEEMLRRSLKYGPGEIPPGWRGERNAEERKRFISVFSPASLVLSLDEMLEEANVTVYLDTLVCDVRLEQNQISGIAVENESGRFEIGASQFIDCSGSAVLGRKLDMPLITGENYLSLWALELVNGKLEMNYGAVYGNGALTNKFCDEALDEAGISKSYLAETKQFGTSGKQVSEYLLKTRAYLRGYYRYMYKNNLADRETLFPVKLPIMPQYRKIYAIKAATMMSDNQDWTYIDDSVGLVADWRRAGLVWEIPYGSLYSNSGPDNLLFAGRCMGAGGDAWEVMRVIPSAVVTGQAAGLAAVLSLRDKISPRKLSCKKLQKELNSLQIPLHFNQLGISKPCQKKNPMQ